MASTATRPTICLAMIVKDEVETLPRLFESCRELIDYWVICDTGSTDGTQALIERELDGIPGELHAHAWLNFGHNRSEAMKLAHRKSDYILILDADTTIEVAPGALDGLTDDAYYLRHLEGTDRYHTKRLVRGDLDWRYEGVVHEYIVSDQERTTGRLDGVTIRAWSVGALRTGRFERDIELLAEQVRKDPEDARAQFYLAQSCRDLSRQTGSDTMLADAADHYERRAEMQGWDEERYFARYQVGVLAAELGDWPRAMDAFVRAWEVRPQRLEAVHALAAGLRERSCHRAAHRFTRMAANLQPLPMPDDLLFVAPSVYEWGMLFEYSITAYWVGEYRNSLAACKRLLNIASLPAEYRELTVANMRHAVREITRIASEQPGRQRRLKHTGTPTRGVPAPDGLTPPALRDSALARRLAESCQLSIGDVEGTLLRIGRPVTVTVAALGDLSIRIRPGTSDVLALDRACAGASHLPDPELEEPELIVDVGAGIGITSLHLAHVYPSARLVVVESDPDELDLCAENLRPLKDRATLVEAAIGVHDRPAGESGSELTLSTLLERSAGVSAVDYLKLELGDGLGAVLRAGGQWPSRVRSVGAAVSGQSASDDAVGQLRRLGFEAHASDGWARGTREVVGGRQRRHRLTRA